MTKNRMLRRFFIALIVCMSSCYSEDFIDIDQAIMNRSQQYSKDPFEKIIQISPTRTGSTLIYNILRFLFEDEGSIGVDGFRNYEHLISKWHQVNEKIVNVNNVYFVTIRNPIDSIYSLCKIAPHKEISENTIKNHFRAYDKILKKVEQLKKISSNVYVLRYEEFIDNFSYIFDVIESAFGIHILNDDKILLEKALSRENVIKYIERYNSFREYSQSTNFHGNHICDEKNQDIKLRSLIVKVLQKYKGDINKMGYDI